MSAPGETRGGDARRDFERRAEAVRESAMRNLEATPGRARSGARQGVERLRSRAWFVLQTALAASAAWLVAGAVTGVEAPFFAPIASVLAISATSGQHARRAVEICFGVALGLGVADAIVVLIGRGTWQLALVVALAMSAALLFRASPLFVNQAAVSAILVATIGSPGSEFVPTRLIDAFIGSVIGLLVGQVVFPHDPVARVERTAAPVFDRLARILDQVATALARGDTKLAGRALGDARALEVQLEEFSDEVVAAREIARLSPAHRRDRPRLQLYAQAVRQLDFALRNVRVLARAVQNATRQGIPGEPELVRAIGLLGRAVRKLGDELEEPPDGDREARHLAAEAAKLATEVLDRRHDLAANVVVAQVRATATDLLRGTGLESEVARDLLGPWPLPPGEELRRGGGPPTDA